MAIREVLFHDWDPLEVNDIAPEDEYDSYIGQVYRTLSNSPTAECVVETLIRIENEYMEHDEQTRPHLFQVAEKLLKLNVRR